ncbi:MAG: hypothetical protein ACYDEV_16895, partial [Acidiferrobacter sp.]
MGAGQTYLRSLLFVLRSTMWLVESDGSKKMDLGRNVRSMPAPQAALALDPAGVVADKKGSSGFRVGKGVVGLHQAPPQASMVPPLRDTELVQKLLGLPAPWRVTAVAVQVAS